MCLLQHLYTQRMPSNKFGPLSVQLRTEQIVKHYNMCLRQIIKILSSRTSTTENRRIRPTNPTVTNCSGLQINVSLCSRYCVCLWRYICDVASMSLRGLVFFNLYISFLIPIYFFVCLTESDGYFNYSAAITDKIFMCLLSFY